MTGVLRNREIAVTLGVETALYANDKQRRDGRRTVPPL